MSLYENSKAGLHLDCQIPNKTYLIHIFPLLFLLSEEISSEIANENQTTKNMCQLVVA